MPITLSPLPTLPVPAVTPVNARVTAEEIVGLKAAIASANLFSFPEGKSIDNLVSITIRLTPDKGGMINAQLS